MVKVSVIIPVFNRKQYVAESIQSILDQTLQDFEIVVVDDGSTDGSIDLIRSIDDDRIHIFSNPGKGVSSAANYGLMKASGEYIARLDSDDIALPTRLEKQAKLLDERKEIGLCGALAMKFRIKEGQR